MPIQVTCTNADCAKTLRVKDELAGKTVRCPGCQQPLKIPAADAAVTGAAPPKANGNVKGAGGPPPVPKAPAAKAASGKAVSAGPPPAPAKKPAAKAPARRDDDDEGDDELEHLWETCEMLKHDRFKVKAKIVFFGGAKFKITNPDTEEELGIAAERLGIFTMILRSIKSIKPWLATVIEVREEDKGPILFTVRKPVQWFSFVTKIEIFNQFAEKIGYFQTKLFSLRGGFWVYDADDNQIAEVKPYFLKSYIDFDSEDGRNLARISDEASEAKKVKFIWGAVGTTITMNEEVREHPNLKVLLLATTLAMELTGVAKRFSHR